MAFTYHQADNLAPLMDELANRLRAERKQLKIQTPQSVVVGSLDIEAYIQESICKRDGILMGVEFPFLESALDNFDGRCAERGAPRADESWFSPLRITTARKNAGMLQLELAVLEQLHRLKENDKKISLALGLGDLSEQQFVYLAERLSFEIREYLLHIPSLMQSVLTRRAEKTIESIWQGAHRYLEDLGYVSEFLLLPDKSRDKKNQTEKSPENQNSTLYLFGMPILSAYHINRLFQVAKSVDVHLFAVHLRRDKQVHNEYYLNAARKYEDYTRLLTESGVTHGVAFAEVYYASARESWVTAWLANNGSLVEQASVIESVALPGQWRGAEIIADRWHDRLRSDASLRQDDFSLALSDAPAEYLAFDKAASARQLSLFSRSRLFQYPSACADLADILATAATEGISRPLLVRYLGNAFVRDFFKLDTEKGELYVRALDHANGFRNDYTGSLQVYNFSSAIQRLLRSLLIDTQSQGAEVLPGAVAFRAFETVDMLSDFLRCIDILLNAKLILKKQKAKDLCAKFLSILKQFENEHDFVDAGIVTALSEIGAIIGEREFNARQLAHIAARNAKAKNLAQAAQQQGICASAMSTPIPFKKHITIWNLNEDIDVASAADESYLADYLNSATHLNRSEQISICLIQAALSQPKSLDLCYSCLDTDTGAEKFAGIELESFKASLQQAKVDFKESKEYKATIFDVGEQRFRNAADAEVDILMLTESSEKLMDSHAVLQPETLDKDGDTTASQIQDVVRYCCRPFHYFYARTFEQPFEPLDFRFAEPKLADPKGQKFRFVQSYIRQAIEVGSSALVSPLTLLGIQERQAQSSPEGFDILRRILAAGTNDADLQKFAAEQAQAYRTVEYIFDARLTKPFERIENERLTRIYVPAPNFDGICVSGVSNKYYTKGGDKSLVYCASPSWAGRSENFVAAYIFLGLLHVACKHWPAFSPEHIEIKEYAVATDTDERFGALVIAEKSQATIKASDIANARKYFEALLAAMRAKESPYFAIELLGDIKLASFAQLTAEDATVRMFKQSREVQQSDFLSKFYQLRVSDDTYRFFDRFIRPMAEADAHSPKKKSVARK